MKTTGYNTIYIDEIKDFTGNVRGRATQKKCAGIDSAREIRITKGSEFVWYRTDYSVDNIENHKCWQISAVNGDPVTYESEFRGTDAMKQAINGILNPKYIPEHKKTTLESLLSGVNIKYVPDDLTAEEKPNP